MNHDQLDAMPLGERHFKTVSISVVDHNTKRSRQVSEIVRVEDVAMPVDSQKVLVRLWQRLNSSEGS